VPQSEKGANLNDPLLVTYPTWYRVEPSPLPGYRRSMTPSEIGTVTTALLDGSRFSPLFKTGWGSYDLEYPEAVVVNTASHTGPEWILNLYGPMTGNTVAADWDKRNQLLAEMIPALSLPVGANETTGLRIGRNHNMPVLYADKVHWPRDKTDQIPNWHHSDMRDVAYPFVNTLYDQLVSLSNP
jgi:hypothetical protein